jgi:lipoate-protein ligase A
MSDAEILGFMRMAYQDVVKALRAAEVNVFLRQTTLVITAGTTEITRTSTPPLPSDLVRPYRIATLGNNDPANRTAIVRTTANSLQAVSDNTMGLWAWRDDGIRLSPSVFNYGVTIQYEAMLPDITSPQDEIKIPDGATAVAMMTAAYAVIMDKPEAAKGLKDRALEIVADIARSEKMAAAANTGNDFFDNG